MNFIRSLCWTRHSCRQGQGLTEYLILVMLVAIGSLVAVRSFGNIVDRKITKAREAIDRRVPDFD